MYFKKKYFLCKPLLLLILLVFGCNSSPENFNDLLYQLAEIDENMRQKMVENWLLQQDDFPIVDNSGVYFIYQEKKDLTIFLSGDMNQWSKDQTQFLRIIGTDFYFVNESYPANSYFDYSFFVGNRFIADPLNNKTSISPSRSSSPLILPQFEYPMETLRKRNYVYTNPDTLKWKLKNNIEHDVYIFNYQFADSNAPIVFFISGDKYLSDLKANIIIENLINSQLIEPCIPVFLPTAILNSMFDDLFFNTVLNNLLPKIQKQYSLSKNRIILGGMLNEGATAFYGLKKYNDKINAVFAQSPNFEADSLRIFKELQNTDFATTKIIYNYGIFENKDSSYSQMEKFLKSKSADFKYINYNEGKSNFSLKGHMDEILIYCIGIKQLE